jgi:thiamine pyrophosphokinase
MTFNNQYTNEQAKICLILAQNITCLYQLPIHIIRLDERTNNIFILAGDDLAITIFQDGIWEFENE